MYLFIDKLPDIESLVFNLRIKVDVLLTNNTQLILRMLLVMVLLKKISRILSRCWRLRGEVEVRVAFGVVSGVI